MWIAQLSDPHVRPAGVPYQGVVDANAALVAAVAQVNALDPLPDLVLLTGDVVDSGTPAEYRQARDMLEALVPPLRVIPGNHDAHAEFRTAFADQPGLPAQAPFHYVEAQAGPVRVVALDVTVAGQHHGALDAAALDWLDGVLAAEPERPSLVMMHQPPLRCFVPYLDAYRCLDDGRLAAVLARHPCVQRVVCGHVHRMMLRGYAGTVLCTAPSTASAIALRPRQGAQPASYLEPPGFLLHHWSEAGLLTHLVPLGAFPGPFPFA